MSKEERCAEHTVAWELPKCDSVTKGNYNLADIETKYIPIQSEVISDDKDKIIANLEAKLAEKDKLLNQYPYKNDVIEEQYEYLKNAITFLMLNNIKDQEQLNHCIDVLCEKHKARIRDIENSICKIEQLEKQLAEKEKEIKKLTLYHFESETNKPILTTTQMINQDKISFTVEQLEKVKNRIESKVESIYKKLDELNIKIVCESTSRQLDAYEEIAKAIDNQIKELKEMK